MVRQIFKTFLDIWNFSKVVRENQRWKAIFVSIVSYAMFFSLAFIKIFIFVLEMVEKGLKLHLWHIVFRYTKVDVEINTGGVLRELLQELQFRLNLYGQEPKQKRVLNHYDLKKRHTINLLSRLLTTITFHPMVWTMRII